MNMKYGDLGKRFLALLIDDFIISLLEFCVWITFIGTNLFTAMTVLVSLFAILYSIIMEGSALHATLGKKVMGLYVSDSQGNGISYSQAVLRFIGKFLTSFTFGVGYLICFFNPEKQCLHDRLAKTYVVEGDPVAVGPVIRCVRGPLAGSKFAVPEEGLMIGRDSVSCQVVIPSSQKNVSRMHCFVTYNPISGVYVVNDRNSSYGTFAENGTKIDYSQPMAFTKGSRFYIATRNNMFEVG